VVGDTARAWLQRVIVVSRDHGMAFFMKGQQQRGAVRPTGHRDQYAIPGRDQAGLAKPVQ
jgi:hypothetical protein